MLITKQEKKQQKTSKYKLLVMALLALSIFAASTSNVLAAIYYPPVSYSGLYLAQKWGSATRLWDYDDDTLYSYVSSTYNLLGSGACVETRLGEDFIAPADATNFKAGVKFKLTYFAGSTSAQCAADVIVEIRIYYWTLYNWQLIRYEEVYNKHVVNDEYTVNGITFYKSIWANGALNKDWLYRIDVRFYTSATTLPLYQGDACVQISSTSTDLATFEDIYMWIYYT